MSAQPITQSSPLLPTKLQHHERSQATTQHSRKSRRQSQRGPPSHRTTRERHRRASHATAAARVTGRIGNAIGHAG